MKKSKQLFITIMLLSAMLLSACNVEIVATYDTVILGSGVSSLVAAAELADNGKRVLIVEKSGIVGGNKRNLSGGVSVLNTEAGDTVETFKSDIVKNNNDVDNFYTSTLVEESAEIPAWLTKQGIELDRLNQMPGNSVVRTLSAGNGEHTGKKLIIGLETILKNKGVKIQYNSKIETISNLDNQYQLNIASDTSVVTVNAKTVILAEDAANVYDAAVPITDASMLTDFAEKTSIAMTNGMLLLESINGDFYTTGEVNVVDTYNYSSSQLVSPTLRSYGAFLVNHEGKRFVNEMDNIPTVAKAIIKQDQGDAYLVFDDVIAQRLKFLSEYYSEKMVIKENSIVDLAEKMGVPEKNIYETIATYKRAVSSGVDSEFERPFSDDVPAFSNDGTEAVTYYAIKVQPFINIHPAYAPISDKFEVLRKGVPMQGMYAIGDSAFGIMPEITLYGTEFTYGIVMGRDAASNVNDYLNRQ